MTLDQSSLGIPGGFRIIHFTFWTQHRSSIIGCQPLKFPLNFQCLSCTHCVLQISKQPAARLGTCPGMSSVHAVCSWLAYALTPQLLVGGASLVPCGITGTGDLRESSDSKCSFSLCTLVQERAVSLGCSKCFVPKPGTPPHPWDGQVEVDSLIPASC